MPPRFARAITGLAFAGMLLLAFVALGLFARAELRAEFERDALTRLGTALHGGTSLRWPLERAAEVIAGAAFGAAEARFADGALQLVAGSEVIEVGLVLHGAIDLQRHPLLRVELDAPVPMTPSVIVRETLKAPLCEGASRDAARQLGVQVLDLATLEWACAGIAATPPRRAAMLRLGLRLPPGSRASLHDIALLPRSAPTPRDLQVLMLPAPSDAVAFAAALDHFVDEVEPRKWPVAILPFAASRPEQLLAARDAIRALEPMTLVVGDGDWPAVRDRAAASPPQTRPPGWRALAWSGVGVLGISLLALRLRPPRSVHTRAAAELVGVLVVPLAFVLGNGFGDDPDPAWFAALAMTFGYAASLLIADAPPLPVAGGARRKGWLVALASVAIAFAFAFALGEASAPWAWPETPRMLRYLAWAAVQQFLVCVIIAERFERVLGKPGWALAAAAFAFAVLHAPNAMLMQFTFLGGLIWVWNWQRHRALLANIVAHAACGLVLATRLPVDWLRSAEVGARYFLF